MRVAAIPYEAGQGEAVDTLLRTLAADMRAKGLKLAGAVQWNEPKAGQTRCDMVLEDLATGTRYDVSANQRGDAPACRLNAHALEDVAGIVASSIVPGLDLVVLNRFGKQEAAKGGFRAVIEAAIANELPILTALNSAHRTLWHQFTGGEGTFIAADEAELRNWCRAQLHNT